MNRDQQGAAVQTAQRGWCSERVVRWVRIALAAQLVVGGIYFVAVRPVLAQSPELLAERIARANERIAGLEAMQVPSRLAVVEDTLIEVKYLGRAVAAAVLGQLLALVLEKKKAAR